MEYYFAIGNEKRGPHALSELASLGVTPDTLIWREGMTEWLPARTVPEVAAALAPSPSMAPNTAPLSASPAPVMYQTAGSVGGGPNGMAIASLVLGIVGLVTIICYGFGVIPSILAIIFGTLARKQIRRDGGEGRGMATAGLICGGIAILILVLLIAVVGVAIVTSQRRHGHF